MPSLFPLGRCVSTPGALQHLGALGVSPLELLQRHVSGDWGELSVEDKRANERALLDGTRILSAYTYYCIKFWVITEADRSATTILLPSEY